ncbi:MAG: rRNA pseudouridine synthase [Clostridia bacterium]|nr:rRNA pseudouridine synthase [Clostridia bacterium]
MSSVRLDKYISVAAAVSRSDAKSFIRKGQISVNGQTVKSVDFKVLDNDVVKLLGDEVKYKEFVYLVMNKPSGILSASSDKRAKTVVDIVPEQYRHYSLFPVGRLDKDTTGLLLITNDGEFAHRIISPKSGIDKLYYVVLDGEVTEEHIRKFADGVTLADGTECLPATLERLSATEAEITIREGKYHQVKRMFGVIGLGVNKLKRISIGKLRLPDDLSEGDCRELTHEELSLLL